MNLLYKAVTKALMVFKRGSEKKTPIPTDVKDLNGKRIEPHGVYYHPMPVIGIQPLSIDAILAPHDARIKNICLRLALKKAHPRFNPEKMIIKVIRNVAEYIHLLPASENYHHESVGGLLAHSLEVAEVALGRALSSSLKPVSYPDLEQVRRERYLYAVFIAGLLHDIGKAFTDMRVFALDNGDVIWEPRRMSLTKWAQDNNVKTYRVEYIAGRNYSDHERVPTYVMQSVLTDEAKEYLSNRQLDDFFFEIDQAIGHYMTKDGYINDALRHADSHSTLKDLTGKTLQETGRRENSLATNIVKTLRRLCATWTINQDDGELWMIGGEVYLAFPKAMEALTRAMKDAGIKGPTDTQALYNIMSEQHIISNIDPDVRFSFWIPGDFTRDEAVQLQRELLNRETRRWMMLCRIKSIHYIYGDNITPQSAPGVLCYTREGHIRLYQKNDLYRHVKIAPPDDKQDKKAPIETAPAQAPETGADKLAGKPTEANTTSSSATKGQSEEAKKPRKKRQTQGAAGSNAHDNPASGLFDPENDYGKGKDKQPSSDPGSKAEAPPQADASEQALSAPEPPTQDVAQTPQAPGVDNKSEEPSTDGGETWSTLGNVAATESFAWLSWCRDKLAEGVMHHRSDGNHMWLLVSKMAKSLMMSEADIALKLKADGFIQECRQRFDPDSREGWFIKRDGEMESLLSDLGVSVLKGAVSQRQAKIIASQSEQPPLQQREDVEVGIVVSEGSDAPADAPCEAQKATKASNPIEAQVETQQVEPQSASVSEDEITGMRVPAAGNGELEQIAELVVLALMGNRKYAEGDIIDEGGMYHVKVSWVKKVLGKRIRASDEWLTEHASARGRTQYISVPRKDPTP